jgi:hypothetical protein
MTMTVLMTVLARSMERSAYHLPGSRHTPL